MFLTDTFHFICIDKHIGMTNVKYRSAFFGYLNIMDFNFNNQDITNTFPLSNYNYENYDFIT